MTQAGFAGNLRYVALPAALVCVLAGAGWVDLVRDAAARCGPAAARRSPSRLAAGARRSSSPTWTSSPSTSTSSAPSPSSYDRLPPIVAKAGGADALLAAGPSTRRRSRSRPSPGRCTCTPRRSGSSPPRRAPCSRALLGARRTIRASRSSTRTAAGSSVATAAAGRPNLMRMATYASRPAWELRARAVSSARVAAPLGIGVLLALSVLLRTRQLDVGFWIDEGLSVGIADRPIGDIPGVLRQDGSPPLYYLLLQRLARASSGGPRRACTGSRCCSPCSACRWRSGRAGRCSAAAPRGSPRCSPRSTRS